MDQKINSKQIADLLNNCKHKYQNISHNSIKRTIERQADRGIIAFTMTTITDKVLKREYKVYHVDENDSYIVAAHIAPELINVIVEYWKTMIIDDDMDLKSLIIEQGKKINKLYHMLLREPPVVEVDQLPENVLPTALQKVDEYRSPTGRVRKHKRIKKEDVLKIKNMFFIHKMTVLQIVEKLYPISRSTVDRIIAGKRDSLLVK